MKNGCGYNSAEEKFEMRTQEGVEARAEHKAGPAEGTLKVVAEESEGSVDGELGAPAELCELPPSPPLRDGGELNVSLLEVNAMYCLNRLFLPPLLPSPEEQAEARLAAQEEGGDEASVSQLSVHWLLKMVSKKLTHANAKGSRTGAEEVLISDQELPGPPPRLGCG